MRLITTYRTQACMYMYTPTSKVVYVGHKRAHVTNCHYSHRIIILSNLFVGGTSRFHGNATTCTLKSIPVCPLCSPPITQMFRKTLGPQWVEVAFNLMG